MDSLPGIYRSRSKLGRVVFAGEWPAAGVALLCAFVVFIMTALALLAWLARPSILASTHLQIVSMPPFTAIAFAALAMALGLLTRSPPLAWFKSLYRSLVAGAIVLALAKFVEYFTPLPFDGQMSPITAFIFILISMSFLWIGETVSTRMRSRGSLLALAVFVIDFIILLGYLYRTPLLYGGSIIPISLPTALCFIFLSLGEMFLTGSQYLPLRPFHGPSARALLLRTFLPVAMIGVMMDGLFHNLVGRTWNPAWVSLISGIVVASLVIVMVSEVSSIVGGAIDVAGEEREKAEVALRKSHDELAQSNVSLQSEIAVRRQAEQAARRQVQRMSALRSIDLAITASLDARVTLNVLLEVVTTQLGVDAAAIHLYDVDTNQFEYAASRGFRMNGEEHLERPAANDPACSVVTDRRFLRIGLDSGKMLSPRMMDLKRDGFLSYVGVPLIAKGNIRGVLEVFHRSMLSSNGEWLGYLETLAGQAAIALDNASLFEDLQRSNAALIRTYDDTLEGWSKALDLRDQGTEGHSVRVADLTVRMARALGVEESQLVHIRRGALLHDIGKMGIPDRILLKSETLNDAEWEIMRKHPVYAFEMLSPISYLRPALDIPYGHHERWDGTGYPRGLRGNQIPLAVRIFSIVDIWDALRYERPYHKAWPESKVLLYLRDLAGTHLDPAIVQAFIRLQPQLTRQKVTSASQNVQGVGHYAASVTEAED